MFGFITKLISLFKEEVPAKIEKPTVVTRHSVVAIGRGSIKLKKSEISRESLEGVELAPGGMFSKRCKHTSETAVKIYSVVECASFLQQIDILQDKNEVKDYNCITVFNTKYQFGLISIENVGDAILHRIDFDTVLRNLTII